jgi:hypothetical protein
MAARAGIARFGDMQSTLDQRIGQQGDLVTSELHGRYYEQAVRKNVFFSLSLVRATSLISTSAIGNIVWNPPDSGVNLALQKWTSIISVTSATCTGIALAVGYQTTTPTGLTAIDATGATYLQQPTFLTGRAKAYAIATMLIAPVLVTLLHHNTAAINTVGGDQFSGDLEGSIIVPPGHYICMAALGAAAAASGHSSYLSWEEVPTL